MKNINSLKDSKNNLDYIMAFFYMHKINLGADVIAVSLKMGAPELEIYLKYLFDKKLIDEKSTPPTQDPDTPPPPPRNKKNKSEAKVYKINFVGIEFCETDSFTNAPDTPAAQKKTICKLYSLD